LDKKSEPSELACGITGPGATHKLSVTALRHFVLQRKRGVNMTSQRPRRPTAWEVSFPGESSGDENGDEAIVPEPDKSEQEELAVLTGKRKTSSIVDDRVRFVPFSIPSLSWLM
jgi:hypothetical protein